MKSAGKREIEYNLKKKLRVNAYEDHTVRRPKTSIKRPMFMKPIEFFCFMCVIDFHFILKILLYLGVSVHLNYHISCVCVFRGELELY